MIDPKLGTNRLTYIVVNQQLLLILEYKKLIYYNSFDDEKKQTNELPFLNYLKKDISRPLTVSFTILFFQTFG